MDKQTAARTAEKYFGFSSFRPGQEEVISALLSGRDVLTIMPTGAGKSLCYQIPALIMPGAAIVISPLISLMQDQVSALQDAGVAACCLHSGLAPDVYGRTLAAASSGAFKLIYIAPERLHHPSVLRLTSALTVSFVVIDEAHCVSQWGHDFRPSYLRIPEFTRSFPARPVCAAFTATATAQVRDDIARFLDLRNPFSLTTGFNRENLYFEVRHPGSKMNALLEILDTRQAAIRGGKSGIIYCATRKTVEEVSERLALRGLPVTRYHAGLSDKERARNQDDFIYDRKPLIVATNAFGMGIDKPTVSFVIHYNMPRNIESYYQEAGRAGRDGEKAECILLYSGSDVRLHEFLIRKSEDEAASGGASFGGAAAAGGAGDGVQAERHLALLKQMTFYATSGDCLRSRLLAYFGENAPSYCGNCSNCNGFYEQTDITVDAQKIVSCVYRMEKRGRPFGKTMIVNVLRGSKNEKIKTAGLDTVSTYGIMADSSMRRVHAILDFLIAGGYLTLRDDEFPVVTLAPRAREIITDKKPLFMMLPKETTKAERVKADTERARFDDIDETLLSKLKDLRRALAAAAAVPAYVIFTDAALHDMCRKRPRNAAEFLTVTGVGAVKAEKYAAAFTKVIAGG